MFGVFQWENPMFFFWGEEPLHEYLEAGLKIMK